MSLERLDFIYSVDGLCATDAWEMIWRALGRELRSGGNVCEFYDERVKCDAVSTLLKKRGEKHFRVRTETWVLDHGIVASCDHCLFQLETSAKPLAEWTELARVFFTPSFVSGRVHDVEYERWQNAADPLIYKCAGRSYAHLPMISNGLPYPLEQMEVDISRNPGRRVIRNGYVEAVGAMMWLGPLFNKRTRFHRSALKELDWCTVNRLAGDVCEIQAWPRCFTSSEGEEGRCQDKLRATLFPLRECT